MTGRLDWNAAKNDYVGDGGSPVRKVEEYKAYILDHDGHVTRRVDLVCVNEDEARQKAKQLIDGHDVELWQGVRRIAHFRPEQ